MVRLHGRGASALLGADSAERPLVSDATRDPGDYEAMPIGGNRSDLLPQPVRWVPQGSGKMHVCESRVMGTADRRCRWQGSWGSQGVVWGSQGSGHLVAGHEGVVAQKAEGRRGWMRQAQCEVQGVKGMQMY